MMKVTARTVLALYASLHVFGMLPCLAATGPGGLSEQEWASMRTAHDAGRHTVHQREDGSHTTRNPAQQWRTEFDGRGFTVKPDHHGWSWGMELAAVNGSGQSENRIHSCPRVVAKGNRLAYHWSEDVEEWFINDSRGLEQGWTIRSDSRDLPRRDDEPLTLALRLRGDLTARIAEDRRRVSYQSSTGKIELNYGGLKAWDAKNTSLDVRFAPGGDNATLVILVDDTEAIYPITIDPVAQQAYLKASNSGTDDQFGNSVAASGDTVVVGAFGEDSSSIGVDGNQSANGASAAGAAYVYVRTGGTWSQQAYLKPSNTSSGDNFGVSVAIDGDTIVVGSFLEDSLATGINGNQFNNNSPNSGAAFVFVRNGTTWTQQAYLKASNTGAEDLFGGSVAISGDTVAVGATGEDSPSTGVNGPQTGSAAGSSGAAYVFVRSGTTWTQQAYLKASNTEGSDQFGYPLAISGETIVVGASGEDSAATGVNGDGSNNDASFSGAAYVFTRSGAQWNQQAYLKASNSGAGDDFGDAVAISGNTIVVGAHYESSAATGINGDESDNSAFGTGAAYVFNRSGEVWTQQAYLKASNASLGREFGISVAVSGETILVGARFESSSATGIDGNQHDVGADVSGAAYVFTHDSVTWGQRSYLKASNTGQSDEFGTAVALSGKTAVVTAKYEGSNATGINGDGGNNDAPSSGAAYVFDLNASIPIVITHASRSGATFTIRFTGEAGATNWRVTGSADLLSFPDDKTAASTITETSPGKYEALVNLISAPGRYFLRIER